VDRYGNINTSFIGDPDNPKVRLPGSGGAADIISLCREIFIVTSHEQRRFVDRVDFVTSPGYLTGGDSRRAAGLTAGRLAAVITDLALLDFEPRTRQMRLTAVQSGVSVAQVQQATGFPLLLADDIAELPEPSREELDLLRELAGTAGSGGTAGTGGSR